MREVLDVTRSTQPQNNPVSRAEALHAASFLWSETFRAPDGTDGYVESVKAPNPGPCRPDSSDQITGESEYSRSQPHDCMYMKSRLNGFGA